MANIIGVLCFGSAATGATDSFSDVDLYVLCQPEIPVKAARLKAFSGLADPGTLQIDLGVAGWDRSWCPQNDQLCIHGLQFELSYATLGFVETVVRKVRRGATTLPEMRFRPYTLLGLLAQGVVLHDPEGRLARLRERLFPYPPKLKQRLLSDNLSTARDSFSDLSDIEKRQLGSRAFHFHLLRCCDAIDSLLFALNERYDPASKRVEQALQALPILPNSFSSRYQHLLETPLDGPGKTHIVHELAQLLDEIETLVRSCQG